jgi:hypothetical protein
MPEKSDAPMMPEGLGEVHPIRALRALPGQIGGVLVRLSRFPDASGYPSEYPKHPERRGAAALIDRELYDGGNEPEPAA